jgi:NAD(P)-dependent dehydrogenase (short-subunit alcohol dehydrogenase family)
MSGVSIAGGDKPLDELTEDAFDHVCAINLRGTIMACKHVLPIMRPQRSIANQAATGDSLAPLITSREQNGAPQAP